MGMEVIRRIRVKKEDSAFVYFILESHEGKFSYSTLSYRGGDAFRDLEIRIPVDFVEDGIAILHALGSTVYWLDEWD